MRKITFIIFVMLFLVSCPRLQNSVGRSRDVVVVSPVIDTTLINSTIQIYNNVPQKEPVFIWLFAQNDALAKFNKFHSLFVYGSLNDTLINSLLSPEAKEATKKDTFNLFKTCNMWARDQLVVIFAVSEPQYINPGIIRYQKMITKLLEENYYTRVKKQFYEKGIDKKIKKVLTEYGLALDIPIGWSIDSSYKDGNFVFIHTHQPDRSIFFYIEEFTGDLSDSFAVNKRNSLTRKYYAGDYALKDLVTVEDVQGARFPGMEGIKVKGVWQNDSLVAGGPFLSYFLKDNDRLYIIDGMLFVPGERKTDYLTTVEIIMNSFKLHPPSKLYP